MTADDAPNGVDPDASAATVAPERDEPWSWRPSATPEPLPPAQNWLPEEPERAPLPEDVAPPSEGALPPQPGLASDADATVATEFEPVQPLEPGAPGLTSGDWDDIAWHRVGQEARAEAPSGSGAETARPEAPEAEAPEPEPEAPEAEAPEPEPEVAEPEPEPEPEPAMEFEAVVEPLEPDGSHEPLPEPEPEPAAEPIPEPDRTYERKRIARTRPSSKVERGRMRRRASYLRALREIQLRDIGGFALELHRYGRQRPDLLEAKITGAAMTDMELRALERALDEGSSMRELREAGIGGACDNCGAVHGSTDRYCATCGEALDMSLFEDVERGDGAAAR